MSDQLMSPKQAADFLNVGANALKKYALMLEHNGYKVSRNEMNHRIYSPADVAIIRAMLILNRIKGVQLDVAASKVAASDADIELILSYGDTRPVEHTAVSTVTQSQITDVSLQLTELITSLQSELQSRDALHIELAASIDDKLSEQTTMIEQLLEQNNSLHARLEAMERKQESDNRKSFWYKLFGK